MSGCGGRFQFRYDPQIASDVRIYSVHSSDDFNDEQGGEAAELHKLAEPIILECKQSKLVSSLQTAMFLLCQVHAQRPQGHASRSDTLRHLSMGLLARFSHAGYIGDLEQALMLIGEAGDGHESSIVVCRNP